MELSEADKLAHILLDDARLNHQLHPGVEFRFDRAKRRLGSYRPAQKIITLSAPITLLNRFNVIDDTIRHEIAHALAHLHDGYMGHGAIWKNRAMQMGAQPRARCTSAEVITPKAPYVYACEVCDFRAERYRRPSNNTRQAGCPVCSTSAHFQPLQFKANR